ncbi:MAG TPA: PDZ domain-containing protein [Bryobacteraceae bacterium]|nr:PDZ domain-containing protein [Bryobacteraceae bacterium]
MRIIQSAARLATIFVAAVGCTAALHAQSMPEGRLLRFPDIDQTTVVFSYGGDLWLVPRSGGIARRITSDPGLELFPKFSPDGKWIAFTGQYDGNFNVYVMPREGGQPRQLTFLPDIGPVPERFGPNNEVISWTPDSKRIVFLSRRNTFNTWFGRLFTVSVEGGLPEQLPIDKGGLLSFSSDGSRIAYNRIFRNFRPRKRYKGGMAQDIWIYDFKAKHSEQITHYPGTDTFPMWRGATLYWASDRGPNQRLNLYSRNLSSGKTEQLTHFKDFDVNWPSLGPDAIVFENGGYLYTFDLKDRSVHKMTVYLAGDLDAVRKQWVTVNQLITDFDIAPDGSQAVFTARGDVYTAPASGGNIRNLTRTPGIREKYSTWSPDGKWIAYVSDRTGEDELYIAPADGTGAEERITFDGSVFRLAPTWSPDSKKLLFADKEVKLWYVDTQVKKPVLIDQGKYGDYQGYSWSPDSQWVAYGKVLENSNTAVYLYSLASKTITAATSGFYSSWNPEFDPGGKYLYFLSARTYNEVIGPYGMEFSNPDAFKVFALTMRKDLPSPFEPPAQEEKTEKPSPPPVPFRIDLAGIEDRTVALPVAAANITALLASKDAVLYGCAPVSGLSGPLPGEEPSIHIYDLKQRKDAVLVSGTDHFALSFDGKKVLYAARKNPLNAEEESGESFGPVPRTFGIVDASLPKTPHHAGDGALNLSSMQEELNPRAEWRQIFNEVWRQERDYFFEPAMDGVNWEEVREKYAPLVDHAGNRYDLTYILSQLVGELGSSHTYVGGGDTPSRKPVNAGLLGVDLEADPAHGLYRIARIYPGENWDSGRRSPLTEPGVEAKAGDYLLAVNGRPVRMPQNPYELFVNTADQQIRVTIASQPGGQDARTILVKPLGSEFNLRELDWIENNRRKVDQMSGGRVGYIYLSDMSAEGLNQFVEQFYPQIRKQGLVIDIRYNGGGFVDQIIFDRLRRILAAMQSARNWKSTTVPDVVFHGYMSCIANAYTASDGDFFAYFFKDYKLGPLVGERTWGGVRGIRGYIPLIDGGYVTRPEFALYGLNSQWLIENIGVEPDVVVDNRPELVMEGRDPQLEKAVDLVMRQIQAHPPVLPTRPPQTPAFPPYPTNPTEALRQKPAASGGAPDHR